MKSSGDHFPPVYVVDKLTRNGTSLASTAHMLLKYSTVLGRLSKWDRLCKWGIVSDPRCCPCTHGVESLSTFSLLAFWSSFLAKNDVNRPGYSLVDEVRWAAVHTIQDLVYKLSWRKRNTRIFQGSSINQEVSRTENDVRA